jgi:ferric-dicitrate binding protein FerR (iron transport regulator)
MEQELFEKYLNGVCSDAEAFRVEDWLHKADKTAVDAFFLNIWNADVPEIPNDQHILLINKLSALTGLPKARTIPMWKGFVHLKYYAAVCLVLLASVVLFRISHPDKMDRVLQKKEMAEEKVQAVNSVSIYNDQDTAKNIRLEDGTTVILFKNSGLRYQLSPEKDRRSVVLTGKAIFNVAKDIRRPFTVFSNDIRTTALGTEFFVHAAKDGSTVKVKLFSGKVLISTTKKLGNWRHDIILLPGTQLRYKVAASVVVSRFVPGKETGNPVLTGVENINESRIVFNNALLPDVMKRLCLLYHIHIHYKASDIDRINFTGVIERSDHIESILNIIAKMNRLEIEPVPNGFEVSRPVH